MATDHRLTTLQQALSAFAPPPGRIVVMAARVMPAFTVSVRELSALDPGARVKAGRVLPRKIGDSEMLEIVTWNTGEASDLRQYGNLTHAERQFFEFMKGHEFKSIEIELTHSPCTACADMLASWLKQIMAQKATISREPNRRVGGRIIIGSPVVNQADIPAVIRWGKLYDTPPQATNWQSLDELHKEGWKLAAPGTALPSGVGKAPVRLI